MARARKEKERKFYTIRTPHCQVDYTKLLKLIKRKRMSIRAFGKRSGLSQCDLYLMQINQMMSMEGEYKACVFFDCDISDIRDIVDIQPTTEEQIEII